MMQSLYRVRRRWRLQAQSIPGKANILLQYTAGGHEEEHETGKRRRRTRLSLNPFRLNWKFEMIHKVRQRRCIQMFCPLKKPGIEGKYRKELRMLGARNRFKEEGPARRLSNTECVHRGMKDEREMRDEAGRVGEDWRIETKYSHAANGIRDEKHTAIRLAAC